MEGDEWYIWNATALADEAIDLSVSELEMRDGQVAGINKLVFRDVETPLIFKTSFDKRVRIFCTSEFKALYEDSGLKGLTFHEDFAGHV